LVCDDLGLKPWIAIYVEAWEENKPVEGDLYLTSLDNFLTKYRIRTTKMCIWEMRTKHKESYRQDKKVMHLHLDFKPGFWFPE